MFLILFPYLQNRHQLPGLFLSLRRSLHFRNGYELKCWYNPCYFKNLIISQDILREVFATAFKSRCGLLRGPLPGHPQPLSGTSAGSGHRSPAERAEASFMPLSDEAYRWPPIPLSHLKDISAPSHHWKLSSPVNSPYQTGRCRAFYYPNRWLRQNH